MKQKRPLLELDEAIVMSGRYLKIHGPTSDIFRKQLRKTLKLVKDMIWDVASIDNVN